MRPIRLTMTAFGPYKGQEDIDFTELRDNNLFVVSGATGAGKTTIFDGISFALYGQASGEDRTDFRAMRSDFADDSVQTTVELLFAIQKRKYRIMRQIPYLKKGNKTETAGRIELYEIKDDYEVPLVDRQIVSEINKKVEQLIGFTQAQFSQIVMLPQGEFRKFLTSDTDNKESILRKIFKTDNYREIVEKLKYRKDEALKEFVSGDQTVKGLIAQIQSLLPARESTVFEVISTEVHNSHQVIEGLLEEITYYNEKIIADKKGYVEAEKKHADSMSAFHEANNLNERLNELNQKQTLLKEKEQQKASMDHRAQQLEYAERAAVIEEIEIQLTSLNEEVAVKKEAFANAQLSLETATKDKEKAEEQFHLEEANQVQREQMSERLYKLNMHLPIVSKLSDKEQALTKMKSKIVELEEKVCQLQDKVDSESETRTGAQKDVEVLENKLLHFEKKSEKLIDLKNKYKMLKEYNKLQQTTSNFKKDLQTIQTTFEQQRAIYTELETSWLTNQAALLAENLHEGEACPVCGSLEHPFISNMTDKINITREELDVEKIKLVEVESKYRTIEAKYKTNVEQLNEKNQEIEREDIKGKDADLETATIDLEKEVDELRKSRETLSELKVQLKKQGLVVENLALEKTDTEKELLRLQADYEKESALIDLEIQEIPVDMRVLSELKQRIVDCESQKRKLDDAWRDAQQNREKSMEILTVAQSNHLHATTILKELHEKKHLIENKFNGALTKSKFNSAEKYYESKMPENDRQTLKQELEKFNEQFHSLLAAVTELTKHLEGKEHVDLQAMQMFVDEKKRAYETALSTYNHSMEYERIAISIKNSIEKAVSSLSTLEMKVNKITDLYDILRGHNEIKLSFERYIQIDYLERIIQSANERLKTLSNGQFELMRSDRQETHGKQSGLGIAVYDAYTGQTRDVKTLSGGEKFNASLCLALGMSDVIQSFQGSVSIETMFIDEGFGSLDEESLNKAIDTLIDLQKSGRLIGVISHVEELKAAFPAILEVEKLKEGHSKTKFTIK